MAQPATPARRADVREETQVRAFVAACVARDGRIDVAFNNARIETLRASTSHEQSVDDCDDVIRTNARGVPVHEVRAASLRSSCGWPHPAPVPSTQRASARHDPPASDNRRQRDTKGRPRN